ncbi:MAG: thioredoxin domain-containing protein [Chlamydiia bacterium]|nr:thioredoxin domain-containing protein [Chlamydiia bacterium]
MGHIIHKSLLSSLVVFSLISLKAFSFDKLDAKYTPSFGDKKAPVQITEYFSFSCEKCLSFINRDFAKIKTECIDTGHVFWTFHPDPADLLTLQLMVCLERLSPEEKGEFFLLASQKAVKNTKKAAHWMRETLKRRGNGGEEFLSLAMIEKAPATKAALSYLKQEDAPTLIPTIEVNGELRKEFPTASFIKSLIHQQEHPCHLKN